MSTRKGCPRATAKERTTPESERKEMVVYSKVRSQNVGYMLKEKETEKNDEDERAEKCSYGVR